MGFTAMNENTNSDINPKENVCSESLCAHWKSVCFSEKTRRQKSPLRWASKVEGTTRYSPGGRRMRLLTSRRLMKVSERAHEEWRRKKSFFMWTLGHPWN